MDDGERTVSRRGFLARCGGAVTAGVAAPAASAPASAQVDGASWPMHRGDAANTAHVSTAVPTDGVRERWRFDVADEAFAPPVVVDGTVYVGSGNGTLYALDAATGQQQWGFSTGNDVGTAPAVVDGTVYFGSDDGNVYAVSAADGSEQWRTSLGLQVRSSPTVVDGTVHVGGVGGVVYALDAATGDETWSFTTNDPVYGAPAVVEGIVYAATENGTVYALDAADGQRYWEVALDARVRSPPAVADGTVYVATGDEVVALATQFGERQWSANVSVEAESALSVTADRVAVAGVSGTLHVLDPATGAERYRFGAGLGCESPVIAGDTLCLGTTGQVRAIGAGTSAQHWSYSTDSGALPSLAVVDGDVYAAGQSGTLYALDGGSASTASATSTGTPTSTSTSTPTSTEGAGDGSTTATRTPERTRTATPTPEPTPTPTSTPVPVSDPSGSLPFGRNVTLLAGGGAVAGTLLLAYSLRRTRSTDEGAAQAADDVTVQASDDDGVEE